MLLLFVDPLKETYETGVGMFQQATTDIEANTVC